jgi:hypothetical protein
MQRDNLCEYLCSYLYNRKVRDKDTLCTVFLTFSVWKSVCINYAGKYSIEDDNCVKVCILFYSSVRDCTLCWSWGVNLTLLQLPGDGACLQMSCTYICSFVYFYLYLFDPMLLLLTCALLYC